jgi:hypothetical protein
MFAMATHVYFKFLWCVCKCFRHMLQVLQLFRTYVTSILSGCCKSRSVIVHITIRVRSERDVCGLCARFSGVDSDRGTLARHPGASTAGTCAAVRR